MLYIVATPIGNLEDITLRAISVLSSVDLIFAEDTRVTRQLLDRYNIKTPLKIYHQHSSPEKIKEIVALLRQGDRLALVTDAGTPGINDPGGFLIAQILAELPTAKIVPVPGANAAITALSISGFPSDKFSYLGFPPHKKGRQKFFKEIAGREGTIVFYESKYRIIKSLTELGQILAGVKEDRHVLVARELTKQFETTYRGTITEVLHELEMHQQNLLGEFVVVVGPKLKA